MAYSGRYRVKNPEKYKGNHEKVYYRSSWELKFMVYCDNNSAILEWGSEEVVIPYISPLDGRRHRYFPDFYIKVKQKDGSVKRIIIEVKPKRQTMPPPPQSRKTKKFINEVRTWGVNEAKFKAATDWTKDRGMEFMILTEEHLG